jgi:hypothetical protein
VRSLREWTRLERAGVVLSSLLLVVGVADTVGDVDIAPVGVYVLVLLLLAALLWTRQR